MSGRRISKLDQAVQLTSKPTTKEDIKKYNENFGKGLALFNKLCTSNNLTPDDKLDVMIQYMKSVPDQAQDMLCKWRDMIPFLKGNELDNMVSLLCKVTRCSGISSHERTITAVTLYNHCFLLVCYKCFADIACDRSVLVDNRVDACRYLYGSQEDEYKQISQESLIEVIDSTEYPSDYRYQIIAGFISGTGINTKLNFTKIRVPYDEYFVYGLQTIFFYNETNGVRERILSGQNLMQMECTSSEEKEEVGNSLIKIARYEGHDENTRADAADVIFRLGTPEQKKIAREIITNLGFSTIEGKGMGSLMDRTKTIYSDSQNIHQFQDQIDAFAEKIVNETNIIPRSFPEVHNEVSECVRKVVSNNEDRFKAFKALNRISIDTARFTSRKVTLAEIFVHVWIRILRYEPEKQEELKKRMVEELIDMNETCSSGHSGRFINVLSDVDVTLKISWGEQIRSNMAGRMMARIRDCPDIELRSRLALAESELADEEDKEEYIRFIEENLPSLREELEKEFVGGRYVNQKTFNKAFDQGVKLWIKE